MTTEMDAAPRWATSADGEAADTSPGELMLLGDHLVVCRDAGGRLPRLRNAVEQIHGFTAPRFITTLVAATAVLAATVILY